MFNVYTAWNVYISVPAPGQWKVKIMFWDFFENPTNWLIWLANVGQAYTHRHLHPISVNCLQLETKKHPPNHLNPPLEESDLCCFRVLPVVSKRFCWNSNFTTPRTTNLHDVSRKTCLVFWLVTKSRYLHCEATKIARCFVCFVFFSENNQSQHPDTGLAARAMAGFGGWLLDKDFCRQ